MKFRKFDPDNKPTCTICGGRGYYKQFIGEHFGCPRFETILCGCIDDDTLIPQLNGDDIEDMET